jgi:cytochrome c peroxidase
VPPLPRRLQLHGSTRQRNTVFVEAPFHNTRLYNLDGRGAYAANNMGVMWVSNRPEDMGRFRTTP